MFFRDWNSYDLVDSGKSGQICIEGLLVYYEGIWKCKYFIDMKLLLPFNFDSFYILITHT